ncbi:putative pyridoxal phosphate-dependent aminotransferase EpsN [uncultured Desulfatiglans sp.]|uniref:Putative pyridoxal phosphate-dependent aminotransferase EpsN n=1 Tax=Uncultured Desulfatiglans sp. TaxID=1748965 RepID=A0A653A6F7_UNCDX|nr:putative pyridoxal phosphate-dependent aminotransferase EpsN [uncultured Desulfatiglans sp.]
MSGLERALIEKAFESNYIAPLGPMVDAFEQEFSEYTGMRYCLAVSSGTAAMHLALHHLGVRPGDEIFASSLTFIGSVSPILFEGATPVFIDCDHRSWNMDPALLAGELERCAVVGKLPKAVVPTDLYGQCCNYGEIYAVSRKFGVPVVVDAAEALGARFTWANVGGDVGGGQAHAGRGARASVFSFNGNKIITTSGGGMLASDDEELISHARVLSQQARGPQAHYEHTEIGFNYRMSNILAAIGRAQLQVLDQRVTRRREIFDYYQSALGDLPGLEFMPEADYGTANRWLTVILVTPKIFGADREQVRLALEAENIESRPVWKPMHLQPVFSCSEVSLPQGKKQYTARAVGGQVSEDLFARGLCLPSGTAMTEGDLDRVIAVIRNLSK